MSSRFDRRLSPPPQDDTIPLLASFLRKNHRDLRLSTLHCLDAIFQGYAGHMLLSPQLGQGSQPSQSAVTGALYVAVLDELPVLINDSDLHISQLVLTLLCTVMDVNPKCMGEVRGHILPNTLGLVLSSLLQGSAMTACLLFFTKLVRLGLPGLDFHSILKVFCCSFSLFPPSLSLFHAPPSLSAYISSLTSAISNLNCNYPYSILYILNLRTLSFLLSCFFLYFLCLLFCNFMEYCSRRC